MSKRVKFSVDEKLYSVNQVLQGRISRNAEAKRIGISIGTLHDWLRKFEEGGSERLKELRTWTTANWCTLLFAHLKPVASAFQIFFLLPLSIPQKERCLKLQ